MTYALHTYARQCAGAFLAALACVAATPASADPVTRSSSNVRLLLAGGHLPICSSVDREACGSRVDWPDSALTSSQYRLDAAALDRLRQQAWPGERDRGPGIVRALAARAGGAALDEAELAAVVDRALAGLEPSSGWNDLTGAERDFLRDHTELVQTTRDGTRRREQVQLDASRDAAAIAVYRRFVELARGNPAGAGRPRVLVVTASARDPFAAVDFYTNLFTQAGADVEWLPLDAALARAVQSGRCDELQGLRAHEHGNWDRARAHPELVAAQQQACADPGRLLRAIDSADAVFLNGGDQSRQFHAWFVDGRPTPAWTRLLARVRAGEVLLGGTSAGTTVQSRRSRPGAAMVTNGSSSAALARGAHAAGPPPADCTGSACGPLPGDTLTWDQAGGLGTFDAGILDTHFSERGRQWRLLVLLEASRAPLALGIDEATAVIATQSTAGWRFDTIGTGTAQLIERSGRRRFRLVRMPAGSGTSWPLTATVDQCVVSTPLVTVDPDRADFDRALAVLARDDQAGGARIGAGPVIAHVCAEARMSTRDSTRRYVVRLQD